MIVRFALICDRCHKRGEEYGPMIACPVCGRDLCPECAVGYDEESGVCESCVDCAAKVRSGEALAVRLAVENLDLTQAHAPELAERLVPIRWSLERGFYNIAAPGLASMLHYFDRQDSPLTDDESIASRHLRAALAQVRRLAGER